MIIIDDITLYRSVLYKVIKSEIKSLECVSSLTINQLAILVTIYDLKLKDKNTVRNISDILGKSMPIISKNLKLLQERNYIVREIKSSDLRKHFIEITDACLGEVQYLLMKTKKIIQTVYQNFNEEELKVITEYQERIGKLR